MTVLRRVKNITVSAPVAQWIEHWSTEPGVGGSSPLGRELFCKTNPRVGRARNFKKESMTKSSLTLHEHFMREALKEAHRAFEKGEVPVGSVVVHRRKIVGRGQNQTETLHDPTAHAEMIAITQAAETLSEGKRDHRGSLEGATLYVTMEPCPMCAGALVLSKAKAVVYGIKDPKAGACGSLYNIIEDDRLNHRLEVRGGVLAEEAKVFLQEFFRNLRKENR